MDPAYAVTVRGSVLGGRFTSSGEPTAGRLPHVAQATHEHLPGSFLLSLMPLSACASPESVQALLEAAKRSAAHTHPGLVAVIDTGDVSEPAGTVFVAERFVDGPTLAAYLGERGFLDLKETAGLVAQMADALATAHVAGFVHGELHPHAIQIEGEDSAAQVRIRGVGWSEEITAARGSQEASPYRAPEHVGRLGHCDALTDQYALAVIAYELLAGCLPFTGESADLADPATLRDRVAPAIAELVPGVPTAVDTVVRKALAHVPTHRYDDVRAFAEALRALVDESPLAPTPPPSADHATAATPPSDGPKAAATSRAAKQKRKGKKKRAAAIHPSPAEFQDDDGPTALENPATLVAAHRMLEASWDASAASAPRQEPLAAPGLTPPRDANATPPPVANTVTVGVTPGPIALAAAEEQLARAAQAARDGHQLGVTPSPHLSMPSIPTGPLMGEAMTPSPSLAPSILPPPAEVVAPVQTRRTWPIIAGGGLLLGGLVVWMLISLLKRPEPPATPTSLPQSENAPAKVPTLRPAEVPAVASAEPPRRTRSTRRAGTFSAKEGCRLSVDSRPWSSVWLDEQDTGLRTPLVDFKIDCGRHTLTVKREDLALSQAERFDATAGTTVERTILLE